MLEAKERQRKGIEAGTYKIESGEYEDDTLAIEDGIEDGDFKDSERKTKSQKDKEIIVPAFGEKERKDRKKGKTNIGDCQK